MWRATFIGIGIAVFLFGAEFLVVERLVFAGPLTTIKEQHEPKSSFAVPVVGGKESSWDPPEWLPWTAMSAGAILVLYSITSGGGGGDE